MNSPHIPLAIITAEVSGMEGTSPLVYDLGEITFPLPVLLHGARPGTVIPPAGGDHIPRDKSHFWVYHPLLPLKSIRGYHQPTDVVPVIPSEGYLCSIYTCLLLDMLGSVHKPTCDSSSTHPSLVDMLHLLADTVYTSADLGGPSHMRKGYTHR